MNLWLVAAIIVGACVVACSVMFAVHRLGRSEVLLADTTRGAGVYAVVGTSFAVLLAFVVLVAFEARNEAKAGAAAEADAVLELSRTVGFFPREDERRIDGELICYGRAVIERDWPAMRDGTRSPVVDGWSTTLQHSYEALPVRTRREEAALVDLLRTRDARVSARRERLSGGVPDVTAPVWLILLVGAAVNIGFVLVFIDRRDEALAVQVTLMATVTTMVVAGLLLVWYLDHPYEDATGSIEPEEMRRTVDVIEQEHGALTVPCTPTGESRKA